MMSRTTEWAVSVSTGVVTLMLLVLTHRAHELRIHKLATELAQIRHIRLKLCSSPTTTTTPRDICANGPTKYQKSSQIGSTKTTFTGSIPLSTL